jgi:hypothetical protein
VVYADQIVCVHTVVAVCVLYCQRNPHRLELVLLQTFAPMHHVLGVLSDLSIRRIDNVNDSVAAALFLGLVLHARVHSSSKVHVRRCMCSSLHSTNNPMGEEFLSGDPRSQES